MRVLYFTQGYSPHDRRFLSAICAGGVEVLFLRLDPPAKASDPRPLPEGVEEISWPTGEPSRFLPMRVLAVRRILRGLTPDLVHAGPIPTVAYTASLAGAGEEGSPPLVSMSWGYDLLQDVQNSANQRGQARHALRRSRMVLADCQAVSTAVQELDFPAERVSVFPWGVDLDAFHPQKGAEGQALRAELGWEDTLNVLSLRSWEPIYGLETVLDGFGRAAQVDSRLRLLLLSDGSQHAMVHARVKALGLESRVHMPGRISQDELARWYHAADLYLSASHIDGSSVTLLEALACGLPALVSDIPGNREWVRPGQEGFLFTVAQPAELAERLLQAAADPLLRAAMGAAARQTAEARADWGRNQSQLIETYHKALAA